MAQYCQHALYHVRILQFIHHQSPLDSFILLLTASHAHAQYVTIQANSCLHSHFGHTPDLKHVMWKTKISNRYRGVCSSHYTGCTTGHHISIIPQCAACRSNAEMISSLLQNSQTKPFVWHSSKKRLVVVTFCKRIQKTLHTPKLRRLLIVWKSW